MMIQERLKQARKAKGISMTFMAEKLGYKSASGYANIESGHTKLSLEAAKHIAEILDVELDELFFKEKLHV
ncbi:helix-turn-helix domain-containing protein [Planomicrobium okeanokoites]|uniref:Helix-turn-helix domain-containing protein n=1 Tax=Planomicrobium okeanokoites TaxID=244 RepID=A0ABV7KTB5_PLAOK|nr:helix-turn-helix transcriptional regulator [Planomicrobium okeanokoites]